MRRMPCHGGLAADGWDPEKPSLREGPEKRKMSGEATGVSKEAEMSASLSAGSEDESVSRPSLKRVLGALLFAATGPVSLSELYSVFARVAESRGEKPEFAESEMRIALDQLDADFSTMGVGLKVSEVAGGYRLVTDAECGAWVRALLKMDRPARLSTPALETLAVVAFRQPVTRSEIEAVRGVNVEGIMRNLLDMQLIKMMGRSDLPGRPMLYGTTQLFLEHFGLNDLKDLPCADELRRREKERIGTKESQPGPEAGRCAAEEGGSAAGA